VLTTTSHFEKVVEMSDNFKKYLASVEHGDVVQMAHKGDRGDDKLL